MTKYFIIIASSILINFQNPLKINGTYECVVAKKDRHNQNGDITNIIFNDSVYTKKFSDGKIIKGKISRLIGTDNVSTIYLLDSEKYIPKHKVDSLINESFGNRIIELQEINSDEIKFRSTYERNLKLTIFTGKLIRKK
jgi:ribosomal protein L35AE/L33A